MIKLVAGMLFDTYTMGISLHSDKSSINFRLTDDDAFPPYPCKILNNDDIKKLIRFLQAALKDDIKINE